MDNNIVTYDDLVKSIQHWNEYRVPILRISHPDKNLNFHGAMRFYFQDAGQKVATKCIGVTSANTAQDVVDVLIEKFRPDMRMLSAPGYALYEVHENGHERRLAPNERPIFVQLHWNKDDREGRFLLRPNVDQTSGGAGLVGHNGEPSLKRQFKSNKDTHRRAKLKKQQQQEEEIASSKPADKNNNGIAQRLYSELPETSFTRSISNPEAVMKRRRAQGLEKRLQEFSLEGGQEVGGTLRIFGETINKDVSYKTLLLSTRDTASSVVKQILEKYGKVDEDPSNYCLVQLIISPLNTSKDNDNSTVHDLTTTATLREVILNDQDCPLLINQNHDKSKGILTFHIRRKPAPDYQKRGKKKLSRAQVQQDPLHSIAMQQMDHSLQMNTNSNNSEQYCNQNSSKTSDSLKYDSNDPPSPSLKSAQSAPRLYSTRNTNGMMFNQRQSHSLSSSMLPSIINTHIINNMHEFDGTTQRSSYSQQNMINNYNRQFVQNQTITNNHYSAGHSPLNQPQQQYISATGANDQILPALIQVKEDVEDIFLSKTITHIIPTDIAFRLAPTYVLYMVSRYRASTLFHSELQAPSRAELFMPFTKKIATMIRNAIESNIRDPTYLAFWLANSSDLSHFYKQDKHLSHFTLEAQEILRSSIKASFKYLVSCKQLELDAVLYTFFDECDDTNLNYSNGLPSLQGAINAIDPILDVLSDSMATMRKNRVNAALTIQLFSHLFHHISKWLFDRLIGVYDNQPGLLGNRTNFAVYCNRIWGEKLSRRLVVISNWAEKQGLEQAADFHFARVTQVTLFLARRYAPRISSHDLREAYDSCDRLNPTQLSALLRRYQPEQAIVGAMIENLLYTMDYNYTTRDYPLEEDSELKIPFLIPEDGYSCELIRYIPNGLLDFVSYLSKMRVNNQELCIFTVQPTSSGHWTVYFKNHQHNLPDVIIIQLSKKNNSIGLSIIAAKGANQERLGIYIKSVIKNGAASIDGRLQAGDQLLEVDGSSLSDITQEQAAELMMRTGPVVTLKVAKQAAMYYNVTDVVNSVSTQTIVSPQAVVQQCQQLQLPPPPLSQAIVPITPTPLEPVSSAQTPITSQSPMRPPKKVSWVDTQPHQSLHTLISLPRNSEPSDSAQQTDGESEDAASPDCGRKDSNGDIHDKPLIQDRPDDGDDEVAPLNGQKDTLTDVQTHRATNEGQADTTAENLTIEDIDQVLSSKTHDNWLEDAAGVIGTQEVYNDPRQRIVKEREQLNADVNTEKLSFHDKLKMFNISAKK